MTHMFPSMAQIYVLFIITFVQGVRFQGVLDNTETQPDFLNGISFPYQQPQEIYTEISKEPRRDAPETQPSPEPTNFEIKATMTKCPNPKVCDCENSFQCSANTTLNTNLRTKEYRSKCEELADDKILKNCEKKVSLTLKIKNKGMTYCNPQYIVLDHVIDGLSDEKLKLLNPYVLKITQRPVYQVYDLLFETVVNAGPSERVVNKNDPGFTGCSTDSANPTCGTVHYDEKEVPYSSGFCCSCASPRSSESTDLNPNINSPSLDSLQQSAIGINKDLSGLGLESSQSNNEFGSGLIGNNAIRDEITINGHPVLDSKRNNPIPFRALRQTGTKTGTKRKRLHRRGGQDCDDDYTPKNADPKTYHDSAHCMDFSDIWYSIYRIAHPDIDHSVDVQIFEKITAGRRVSWREVTGSGTISVGTSDQRYANKEGNILAYYTINPQVDSEFALDCKSHMLLIPEVVGKDVNESQYPEMCGGPPEYLVIRESDVDLTGQTCNKPGVGYEAFAKQAKRCDSDQNSCLQNQPKHMWKHDHDLESSGKKGCYFLKNFGLLPQNPVHIKPCNGSVKKPQNKLLFMYYLAPMVSSVNINFAADTNSILKPDSSAMITEVYTETLNPKKVTVTAKIFNSGLVTSVFYVGIGACPLEIPASFGSISSQPVLIAPQNQHMFNLEIYCELPIKNFYCSLEVFNLKQQLIAVRRIRFKKTDRCICVWYCLCTCYNSDYGLKCNPLEIEQYHAAGFQGGMPVASQVVNYSALDDTVSLTLHIILYFCLTLWYMGLIKALIGCCVLPIGLWGLDRIFDLPKKLNKYYEPELQDVKVVYDDEGWPIHPETGKKVHNVAPPTQFAINMVFFFLFPLALVWNTIKNLLGPKYSTDDMLDDLYGCQCHPSQAILKTKSNRPSSVFKCRNTKSKNSIKFDNKSPSKESRNPSRSSSKADGSQKKKSLLCCRRSKSKESQSGEKK